VTPPVRIDGSQGEGGGQILRTAVSLSAITGKPIEVTNIRAKRENPGLRPQHMTGVKILADLFHADIENLQVGASLSNTSLVIEITGGTDVRASPTIDYVRHVVTEAYRSIGIKFSIEVHKRGYYPKGGGIVQTSIEPCKEPGTMELLTTRDVAPRITSVCGQLPRHVAERQTSSAMIALEKKGIRCSSYSASVETSISPGSSILIYSTSDFGPYVGGDSIGEIGKRAEAVGAEAAERYLESTLVQAPVDPFLADMLVLPLALAKGRSKYRVARVTEHLRTNLQVASQMVGCKYGIEQQGRTHVVTIEG
jgi:RNA 3'-terminal phosphate cyclase (ATP)